MSDDEFSMNWTAAETNSHQDHVIAHVTGTTVLGFLVWDETAYLLLDIGFIWNIYLDGQMGLVPHHVAVSELQAGNELKDALKRDVDRLLSGDDSVEQMTQCDETSPIRTVEFLADGLRRKLQLNCESDTIIVETSLENAEVKIYAG